MNKMHLQNIPSQNLKHAKSAFCHDFMLWCITFFHFSTVFTGFSTLFLFFVPVGNFTCVNISEFYTSSDNISELSANIISLNVVKLAYMTLASAKLHVKQPKLVQTPTSMKIKCSTEITISSKYLQLKFWNTQNPHFVTISR